MPPNSVTESDDGHWFEVSAKVDNAAHMHTLGASIGQCVGAGERLLLVGPFGAGKTTLVQGVAAGLGVDAPVSSPSFVLEAQYRGRLRLFHIDLYRLSTLDPSFGEELGEHLFGDGVCAVEWPELLPPEMREGATRIDISADAAEKRTVRISTLSPAIALAVRKFADAPR